jgi:hypothetical protein
LEKSAAVQEGAARDTSTTRSTETFSSFGVPGVPTAEIHCAAVDLERQAGVPAGVPIGVPGVHAPLKSWHAVALQLRQETPGVHAFTVALALEQQGFPGVSGRAVKELFDVNPVEVQP